MTPDAWIGLILGAGWVASMLSLLSTTRAVGRRPGWFANWVVPWWRTEVLRICPNCQRSLRRYASCWMCIEVKR